MHIDDPLACQWCRLRPVELGRSHCRSPKCRRRADLARRSWLYLALALFTLAACIGSLGAAGCLD